MISDEDFSSLYLSIVLISVLLFSWIFSYSSFRSSKKKLKGYKDNFSYKFINASLFGFILIFLDIYYWLGLILSMIIVVIGDFFIDLKIFFVAIPMMYIILFISYKFQYDDKCGEIKGKPYVKINDPLIVSGFSNIFKRLEVNLNAPLGKLKHRWAMPAGKFIPCYLWDTAFISLVWKYWDMELASEILLPLLDNQSEDGRIPHFVSFFSKSEKIQPPLIAWAISNLEVSINYLKNAYPKLKQFNNWLYKNRRLKNGLFYWLHSYESGMDNSPRFTDRSEKQKRDLTKIAAIDLNAFIVLQNQSLIKIAEKLVGEENLGDIQDDINNYEQKNKEQIELIQNFLWSEDHGLYFDYDIENKKHIEINSIASFFPLLAEIPNEQQAKRLVKHLESPYEYNTKIPLPTVALNDDNFEKDTWRGPVWINTAYLIIKGLEKYRRCKLASEIAFRLIRGIFETWNNEGSFFEFYDPERYDLKELTRKKGNLFKQITLGGKPVKNFIGWTGIVNSLLIESVIGYDILKKTIRPSLPVGFKGKKRVIGFPLDHKEIEIAYYDEKNITISIIDQSIKKISEYSSRLYELIHLK
ncbi:MAG: MGH1-like glycoside hydrolase domain-containing protein [Candidatus Helarchaeota archaeon]